MSERLEKVRQEIAALVKTGDRLAYAVLFRTRPEMIRDRLTEESQKILSAINLEVEYQKWYSAALAVVRQVLKEREADFRALYEYPSRRSEISVTNFRIADALRGVSVRKQEEYGTGTIEIAGWSTCYPLLQSQSAILKSAEETFSSSLFDIQQVLQADLFDSELDAAEELNKKGFSRAAGAMVGVVLEKHFKTVLNAHSLTLAKKNPCINDYNQKLKDESIIDVPTWRFIQRLGDLRNLCDHDKGSEPQRELIAELIDGVDRIMKTLA